MIEPKINLTINGKLISIDESDFNLAVEDYADYVKEQVAESNIHFDVFTYWLPKHLNEINTQAYELTN